MTQGKNRHKHKKPDRSITLGETCDATVGLVHSTYAYRHGGSGMDMSYLSNRVIALLETNIVMSGMGRPL